MGELAVRETNIPGFYEVDLVVHGDNRGWFKENYQKILFNFAYGMYS